MGDLAKILTEWLGRDVTPNTAKVNVIIVAVWDFMYDQNCTSTCIKYTLQSRFKF